MGQEGRAVYRGLRGGNSPVVRAAVDRLRLLRYGRRHVAAPRPAHRENNRAVNGGRQPSDAPLNSNIGRLLWNEFWEVLSRSPSLERC